MRSLLITICLLASLLYGCTQSVKQDEEHRKFVKIAALKYILYSDFTVKDFDNDILYREGIRKNNQEER